jgi:hypothetical protein
MCLSLLSNICRLTVTVCSNSVKISLQKVGVQKTNRAVYRGQPIRAAEQ